MLDYCDDLLVIGSFLWLTIREPGMTMRTLTIGDRTISYDTGLNYMSPPHSGKIFRFFFVAFFYFKSCSLQLCTRHGPTSYFTHKFKNGSIFKVTLIYVKERRKLWFIEKNSRSLLNRLSNDTISECWWPWSQNMFTFWTKIFCTGTSTRWDGRFGSRDSHR